MEPVRRPANVPCQSERIYLLPSDGSLRSVLLAPPGAREGTSSARAPSFRKPTPLSGSAVSETEATERTAKRWHTRWQSSVALSRPTACLTRVLCCDWTVSPAQGPSSQMWMASAW
jgi:hypothetical protein